MTNPLYTTGFMAALFEEEGKDLFDVRQAILGHLQRGGDPTPFDRIQATRLAAKSIEFLIEEAGKPDGIWMYEDLGYRNGLICSVEVLEESMKVYVGYSKNLLTSLGRILGDVESYGSLKDDLSTATIEVLCTDASILKDVKLTRFNVSLYAEQYISSGYAFYKPTNLVKYKLDVKIYANNYAAYYVVDLVNSRNEKILVGVFDKKSQCDSFLALYYPDNVVRHFYTANNL